MQLIYILLSYLAVSASALNFPKITDTSHKYSCIGSHKPCTLQGVFLESENELAQVTFPAIANPLIIESGRIPNFSRKLADKLAGIVDLTINHLQLKTLFINPEMTHLEAKFNHIEIILLNSTKSYEMSILDLTGNMLPNVEILSKFTKLRHLTLDQNKLEKLSMSAFTDMPELRKLSLANNQLFTVDTEKSLQLSKLRSLSLAGNQLIELNVEKWEFDSLTEFDLRNNKLYLLGGDLGKFQSLVDVKISENHWKCEYLLEIIRLDRLIFDHDKSDRCVMNGLSDVKQVCCTYEASGILGYTAVGDLGLFHDKWEELSKLNKTFEQFKNATTQNQQRIGDLEDENEISLMQRIKYLEVKQLQILDKFNDRQESVAVKEINDLKKIVSSHKSTFDRITRKQFYLESDMEDFIERFNSLRPLIDEKLDAIDKVMDKVTKLENEAIGGELVEKWIKELTDACKHLESQQIKYFISSVDLRKQIATERTRITEGEEHHSKLIGEIDRLRQQMSNAEGNIGQILDNLMEMSNLEI